MVTCEPQDRGNSTYKQLPRLIIEVLFDSTEAFDRRDKFADYQLLPTLQEYVLINTRKARIECFRRTEEVALPEVSSGTRIVTMRPPFPKNQRPVTAKIPQVLINAN